MAAEPEDGTPETSANAADLAEADEPTIVGIGASAGGLEALSAVISHFTLDNSAFVVVQHLAPDRESRLTEILSQSTKMTVNTISDGVVVQKNRIYVAPPNADVALLHGALHLMPLPTVGSPRSPRPSIDLFFRSLAADQRERAIGVILSGAGTDGTAGLKAIKAEGGITFVQDPATARHESMPRNALDSRCADFVLPPDRLGPELMRVSQHPYLRRPPSDEGGRFEDDLSKLFILLRKEFGTDFTYYKHNTIQRRVERRMALHKINTLGDYLRYLQSNINEVGALYGDILIGVTTFFRDGDPFDALETRVFPRLLEHKQPGDPFRIWSPGCSTGEETYSLAMRLLEWLGDRAGDYKIQLFGTDLDSDAIQSARRGIYPQALTADVSAERLHRFFWKHDGEYQITRSVRDLVVFAVHDLTRDAPFSHVDLVSCRNLLIYMQPILQKKVLRILHYALNPGGFLLLGTSETVGDSPELFTLIDRKNKIYARKNATATAAFDLEVATPDDATQPAVDHPPRQPRPLSSVHQLADRKLLDRYTLPGVLVNDEFDILQYRGQTGPYLEPLPGAATLQLLKNVRAELQPELRKVLLRVRAGGISGSSEEITIRDRDSGQPRRVSLDVIPIQDQQTKSNCFLVVFKPGPQPPPPAPDAAATGTAAEAAGEARSQDLERELVTAKEYLQSTVEELETANEELKSSNEELQSSNEELQSTNEELETSKEELQSSNEELTTVNDELQNRMRELSQSNDDLTNLLSSVSNPVVIVGTDGRIRRFSLAAEEALNLTPADVGRRIGYLGSFLQVATLEHLFVEAMERAMPREADVVVRDRWYTMRLVPYLTADRSIRGVVIVFSDVTARRHSLEQALSLAEYASKLLVAIRHPLLILDQAMRVVWANGAFYAAFAVSPEETLGKILTRLGTAQWAHPRLVSLIQAALDNGLPFNDFILSHGFPQIGHRTMKLSGKPITGAPDQIEQKLVLIGIEQIEPRRTGSQEGSTEEHADG